MKSKHVVSFLWHYFVHVSDSQACKTPGVCILLCLRIFCLSCIWGSCVFLCLNRWHLFCSLMTHLHLKTCSQSMYFACSWTRFSLLMSRPSFDHPNVIFFSFIFHFLFLPFVAFFSCLLLPFYLFSSPSFLFLFLVSLQSVTPFSYFYTHLLFHLSSSPTCDSSLVSCILILS